MAKLKPLRERGHQVGYFPYQPVYDRMFVACFGEPVTEMAEDETHMDKETDDRQWCYEWQGHEEVEGPFASRDEALAKASDDVLANSYKLPRKALVGRVRHADPMKSIEAITLDDVIDDMNDAACDDCFGWAEGPIFDVREGASEALKLALQQWAHQWVSSSLWTIEDDHEWTLGIDGQWREGR